MYLLIMEQRLGVLEGQVTVAPWDMDSQLVLDALIKVIIIGQVLVVFIRSEFLIKVT